MLEIADKPMIKPGVEAFRLPPLILHPFSSTEDTSLLMASSRASLALQGFVPRDETPLETLDQQLLRGRYAELRMLFYIGKDVARWTEQCAESAVIEGRFGDRHIKPQTFAMLLTQQVPPCVRTKLESWGVLDFNALFRRSYGLHAVFLDLPAAENFPPEFLRRYHPYLDQWYEQRLRETVFSHPEPGEFFFELYASGEYSSMLAKSWAEESNEIS